jgi:8-oxo-dGTP diphosphatase
VAEYAGVLVFHDDALLLVRERYERWDRACWNVPSGRLEPGEPPEQGAVRELLEETGVRLDPAALTLVSTVRVSVGGATSSCWNFTGTTSDAALRPADPDGLVEEAAWFGREEAARLLQDLPSAQIRVPALDHLATRRTGVRWTVDEAGVRERTAG